MLKDVQMVDILTNHWHLGTYMQKRAVSAILQRKYINHNFFPMKKICHQKFDQ